MYFPGWIYVSQIFRSRSNIPNESEDESESLTNDDNPVCSDTPRQSFSPPPSEQSSSSQVPLALQTPIARRRKIKAKDTGEESTMHLLKAYMEEQSDRPNIEGTLTNIFKNMAQRVKMLPPLMQSEIVGQVFKTVHTAELNFRRQQETLHQNRATIYCLTYHRHRPHA